ncbi:N-acetylmuramoyl-L-alanine amidase [Halanaerobiaceae bacterium Z-7014]|uniref:N-acetylmuramoyl-L-alanine amidase n=1 Tax=Halonatronomonas betaini TaxID=2778430 RepID=A0A931F5E2_9FIRM|nr:N-acetylmuramoyl-L-alanine amidase [Halonatronomonas betaini]MBF8435790.1 N-acetylmuramoyl-L-alanine amidase [Halonatronomonas betaini]
MNQKKLSFFLLVLTFAMILLFSQNILAETPDIYYHGEEITEDLNPEVIEDTYLVDARALANHLDLELEWVESLKSINLSREEKDLRMMIDHPYIQTGNSTQRTEVGARLIDETSYIPLNDVVRAFGYLTNYEDNGDFYIFRPETKVYEAYWSDDERMIFLDMDEITPYRIAPTDDPKKMKIEVDKAALSDDFLDNVSNENFNLRVRENEVESRLEIIITSLHPIPYRRDGGIEEDGSNLVVTFNPRLVNIDWRDDDFLEIEANSAMERPEIFFLEDPRRMIIDIPDLMLSEVDLDIDENEYVKDIRLSQFSEDPVVLRVVLELTDDAHLGIDESVDDDKLVFRPTEQTIVSDLAYEPGMISFVTNNEINPGIFTLPDPDRLVINMLHTSRSEDFPDKIEVDNSTMKEIRSSRFDRETVRLVAELYENSGYEWEVEEREDGKFYHTVKLENRLREIYLTEQKNFQNLHVDFTGNVDYEVRKFSHPHRIAIDIKSLDREDIDDFELPEPEGMVEEVRKGIFESGGEEFIRVVFELNDFYNYQVLSGEVDSEIMVSLAKEQLDDTSTIIVLDPGHGGFDAGAIGPTGLTEKEVALAISLKAAEILENNDHQVILTRDDDTFVTLNDRVDIANNSDAGLFVSVHSNAAHRNSVGGIETYHAPNRRSDSYMLANIMQRSMLDHLGLTDRGVKSDNFYVIRNTEMPAVLLEIGFLSNREEEELLRDSSFREEAAQSIAEGIEEYLNQIHSGEEE